MEGSNKSTARKILAQGDRDGACLLYSLANAAQTMSGKTLTVASWTRALDALPLATGEFLTKRGSASLDHFPHCLELLAATFLASAGLEVDVVWTDGLSSPTRLKKHLDAGDLLVMEVDNGAHWVTALDASSDEVFFACSLQLLGAVQSYQEALSPHLNRLFNYRATFAELETQKAGVGLVLSRRG